MAKKEVGFQVLNINLKSTKRKGEDAYSEIIETIFKSRKYEEIASDRAVILRTQFKIVKGKYLIYYGYISKFTTINGTDWLNYTNMEKEKFEIPSNLFPNLKETTYVFVPALHRMAIINSSGFSMISAEKFFKKAVINALNTNEKIKVTIEQDVNEFKELLEATRIIRLELEITYSNADITDDAAEIMDNELRNSGVGDIKIVATPDSSDNIDLNESKTLKGLTELSGSNGYAKATIIGSNNKKKFIDTRKHPKKFKAKIINDDFFKSIANKLAEVFGLRTDNNN